MPNLNLHQELSALERAARRRDETTRQARAALGHRKVAFGLASAGLRDLLDALNDTESNGSVDPMLKAALNDASFPRTEDHALLAQLGEALRVYARDVQASRPGDDQLVATLEASIVCFEKAQGLLTAQLPGEKAKDAWLCAHRGAARMMLYWLELAMTNKSNDDRFNQCEQDFARAIQLMPGYAWSLQFSAFLHALRGSEEAEDLLDERRLKSDFDIAIARLELVPEEMKEQASFWRSLAMLYSYNAAGGKKAADEQSAAAELGIDASLKAKYADADEFLAAYSGAACRYTMYERDGKKSEVQLRDLKDAIETAETRARNAVSQAITALLGLTFLRTRLPDNPNLNEQIAELKRLYQVFTPDLESFAMFIRDPIWRAALAEDDVKTAVAPAIGSQNLKDLPNRNATCQNRKAFTWNR